jgi:muconolactone D-isomerase
MMKFLVNITIDLPPSMPKDERADLLARELERGNELIASGELVGIWRVPGRRANVSIYEVADADALHTALSSLPLFPWLDVQVQALATHPLGVPDVTMTSTPQ